MQGQGKEKIEQRATYASITGLFVLLFTGFNLHQRSRHRSLQIRPFDLVQLGLATFRIGRLVAYDKVTETYRLPFARTVKDPTGAGDTTMPVGTGAKRAIGELITCPICSGTWIAAGLVYGLGVLPGPTRVLLAIMSSIGLAEFLNAATEAMEWLGQAAREEAGKLEEQRS